MHEKSSNHLQTDIGIAATLIGDARFDYNNNNKGIYWKHVVEMKKYLFS